jgi:hypothetical protein
MPAFRQMLNQSPANEAPGATNYNEIRHSALNNILDPQPVG